MRVDNTIRDHFDRNITLYTDKYLFNYRRVCDERLDMLRQHFDPAISLRMLDVGCGGGLFADMVLRHYGNAVVYALDFSLGMLRKNRRGSRKLLIAGDAKALPFGSASFDLINVDTVMHHLVDRQGYRETIRGIGDFLQRLRSLLRPGGMIAFREIYHEFVFSEALGSRVVYSLSTAPLPQFAGSLLRKLGLNTVNAGVCFLTRDQWATVVRESGYRVLAMEDRPWNAAPYLRFGFKASGDIHCIAACANRVQSRVMAALASDPPRQAVY